MSFRSKQDARPRRQGPNTERRTLSWAFGTGLSVRFVGSGSLALLAGHAMCSGREVPGNQSMQFVDEGVLLVATAPVSRIEIEGTFTTSVVSPSTSPDELASLLLAARISASASSSSGPVALIVGPVNTGKSTLFKTLVNRALMPIGSSLTNAVVAVELDIGQPSMSCPGTLSAAFITEPLLLDGDFQHTVPLSFFFGSVTVSEASVKRYLTLCTHLNRSIEAATVQLPEFAVGGMVINTMGWVTGIGYEILMQCISVFRVTHIFVAAGDHELLSAMQQVGQTAARGIIVRPFAHTEGVVSRSSIVRKRARQRRIDMYFNGIPRLRLTPTSMFVERRLLILLDAITGEAIPDAGSVKPLSLVAVVSAGAAEAALDSNIAGFIVWLECGEKMIHLLAPSAGPLPSNLLLVSTGIEAAPSTVPVPVL